MHPNDDSNWGTGQKMPTQTVRENSMILQVIGPHDLELRFMAPLVAPSPHSSEARILAQPNSRGGGWWDH